MSIFLTLLVFQVSFIGRTRMNYKIHSKIGHNYIINVNLTTNQIKTNLITWCETLI